MGPGPRAKDWAVGFVGGEEAHYRRRWRALHAAVRLLRTRRPTPEEYDSWARPPCQRLGHCFRRGWRGTLPQAVACSSRGGLVRCFRRR